MTDVRETVTDNPARAGPAPALSVLIPFFRDDPRPLLSALDAEDAGGAAELVALDDCGGDPALSAAVRTHLQALRTPARLVALDRNEGRAKGRNRLARHARAPAFLFLDADMAPDRPDFLGRWLEEARSGAAVAFGGFTVRQAPRAAATDLHRALSSGGDCAPAEVRRLQPEKHVYTSNLLIRRDVFEAEAFDEGFAGWGWEDVEWGMRVARRWPIRHVDITATHLGLDPAPALLGKYEQSAANFARVVRAHPEVVSRYPSYRAARAFARAPLRALWRPWLKRAALTDGLPLRVRSFAARAYRAALYAEVV